MKKYKTLGDIVVGNDRELTPTMLEASDNILETMLEKDEKKSKDSGKTDEIGVTLGHLSDIMAMADELYSTMSELDKVDSSTRDMVKKIHVNLDDFYVSVEKKYDIDLSDKDKGDLEEEYDRLIAEGKLSKGVVSTITSHGFEKAKPGPKTYQDKANPIDDLYGIPMRAGHYADIFIGSFTDGKYFIKAPKGLTKFDSEADLSKQLKKLTESDNSFFSEAVAAAKPYKYSTDGRTLKSLPKTATPLRDLQDLLHVKFVLDSGTQWGIRSGEPMKLIAREGRKSIRVWLGAKLTKADLGEKYTSFGFQEPKPVKRPTGKISKDDFWEWLGDTHEDHENDKDWNRGYDDLNRKEISPSEVPTKPMTVKQHLYWNGWSVAYEDN